MLERLFELYTLPLVAWIENAVNWLVVNYRPVFQAMRWPVDQLLEHVQAFLQWLPAEAFILLVLAIGWGVAGRRVGLFCVAALVFLGFLGAWEATMTTISLVITAVTFCVAVGIPLGILAARSDAFHAVLRPVLDAMQTTPSFAYLVPIVMLFGIGNVPAVMATIVFSLPPMIKLTNLGIRQVSSEVVEAAYAFGSSPRQVLWEVQLPLALPTIMAGLNQTIMMALAMSVVAAMIAAGGLGLIVFRGIGRLDIGLAAIGGLGIVLVAIMLDRITQALARAHEHNGGALRDRRFWAT